MAACNPQRRRIPGKSARRAPEQIPRHLIQQDAQGDTAGIRVRPGVQDASQRAVAGRPEGLLHQPVERVTAGKPVCGTVITEPEMQNGIGGHV